MSLTLSGSGAPRLQRSWDSRAACNFIGGGSGAGLLVVAAASLLAGRPYLPAGILAIALIGFGLSMVWLEIGRPLRALNVFFHPQTSWMTREALLALPVLGFAALAVLLDQRSAPLPFPARVPIAISASLAALLGLAFLYCQARILRASVGIPAWREPALQWVIIVAGIAEGLGLLLVLGIFGVTPPSWAVPVGILAVAARAGAWQHYRRRVKLIGPAQSITALDRVSVPVHLLGHVLAVALLGGTLMTTSPTVPAAIGGLIIFATGAWLKLAIVTRAAFTQGFSVPFVPVRGSACDLG